MQAEALDIHSHSRGCRVGRLFLHGRGSGLSTTFEYGEEWLGRRDSYPLSSHHPLNGGLVHQRGVPCFLDDSCPDRWGRSLLRKSALQVAGEGGRNLDDVGYLLAVDDVLRQGDLRISRNGGEAFESPAGRGARIDGLPNLVRAADRVHSDRDGGTGLARLLAAGAQSLGGAHPKVPIEDGGALYIAKFGVPGRDIDEVLWEYVALRLAADAGLDVPQVKLLRVEGRSVLLTRRFDRAAPEDDSRLPFLSGMSLLGLEDMQPCDYLDLAEGISVFCGHPIADHAELLGRIALSILVNNKDDHLRNHGFLYEDGGWRLSPLYDVTMNPDPSAERRIGIMGRYRDGEFEGLGELGEALGFGRGRLSEIVEPVCRSVSRLARIAGEAGAKQSELARLEPIIEARLGECREYFGFDREDLAKGKNRAPARVLQAARASSEVGRDRR